MAVSRKEFLKLTSVSALGAGSLNFSKNREQSLPLIKPARISRNSTIGLVAPGSPIYDESQFDKMISDLEGMGYTLKLGKHIKDRNGYLAGKDEDRAADLMAMFEDSEVDGILCTRGGWGCNRILPLIDFDIVKANPKVFAGFSDITSLHMAIQKNTGLVTFHGPVGKSEWNPFTVESWEHVVFGKPNPTFMIPDDDNFQYTITPGKAQGRLLGGNLTVLTSMIGSDYLPDFEGSILFLEDVGEDVYRIDRMLTQLKLSGILNQINGFVFGKCTDCDAGSNSLSLEQVFADHLGELDIPAFYGAMISHESKNITLPVGINAEIDADLRTITLMETGVK